ncbi:Hypothetical protein CINCED_3A008154 [Cinara cedri]|uniref:Uncharacterized protein n=1 Tax=Cinara cedri TaxID=506608 RepID=A0A5E4N3I7_9HEMI|nr:Hypothetical protein CINCED_3A008154 [Cinara cedri]
MEDFSVIHSGNDKSGKNGIAIIVQGKWKSNIMNTYHLNDRLLMVKIHALHNPKQFFEVIQTQVLECQTLSTLPVSGVTITTVVEGRSGKITQQVLIPLTVLMILGNDWLLQQRAIYPELTNQDISKEFEEPTQHNSIVEYPFPIVTDSSVMMTTLPTQHEEYLPIESCINSLNSIYTIDKLQCDPVISLFLKYQHIFRTRSGLNSLYTCRFSVFNTIPFKGTMITEERQVINQFKEHFEDLLNRPSIGHDLNPSEDCLTAEIDIDTPK